LRPILSSIQGNSLDERKARLLNQIREHVATILFEPERWTWAPIAEVIADRLEGSRRSIKGTLFEAIVRRMLTELFEKNKLPLSVGNTEIKLGGETYDVSIVGKNGTVLMPVKTIETMGGGHALLFTRDIHKSISVAQAHDQECIPIVIAESWSGDLNSLKCKSVISIDKNPNQILEVEPILKIELEKLLATFVTLAG
jgi:hypothetical protein